MLIKTKQDSMPYKQPKNTPMHNKDGASEPISIIAGLALAGKALAAKLAAVGTKAVAVGGKKIAAKAATKAAANLASRKAAAKAAGKAFKTGAKQLVKEKAPQAAASAASAGIRKIQESTQQPESTADNFLPNYTSRSSSYANPMGPSAKMSQGTKTNQGTQRTNPPVFSSLSRSNLKKEDESIGGRILEGLKDIDANVNIKGVSVNIGDVVRTGAGIARGADKLIKDRKKLKEIERRAFNKKQSAYRAKQEKLNKQIMQNLKSVSDRKGL